MGLRNLMSAWLLWGIHEVGLSIPRSSARRAAHTMDASCLCTARGRRDAHDGERIKGWPERSQATRPETAQPAPDRLDQLAERGRHPLALAGELAAQGITADATLRPRHSGTKAGVQLDAVGQDDDRDL